MYGNFSQNFLEGTWTMLKVKKFSSLIQKHIVHSKASHFVSKSQKFVFYLLYFGGQSWSYKKDTTTQQLDYIYDEIS